MFDSLKNAWKIADLRKKILYTLLIIFIFRLGSAIPVPFLNPDALSQMTASGGNTLFGFLDVFTGGAFSNATIFALSITPYINSSIIMQLLTVAIPALERLAKEGRKAGKNCPMDSLCYLDSRLGSGYRLLSSAAAFQCGAVCKRFFRYLCRCGYRSLLPGRHRSDHVAGRTDQPEGNRQRHFAADLCRYRFQRACGGPHSACLPFFGTSEVLYPGAAGAGDPSLP